MATNIGPRNGFMPPNVIDSTRLQVVAVRLFGGVQLAVDITLVSPLHCDGTVRRHTAHVDGAVLEVAWHKKGATHPNWWHLWARARLDVSAGEVNGRWSDQGFGQSTDRKLK